MPNTRQFCTFFVDGMLFGIDILNVQEVIRHHEMTRVPHAPTAVRGLINLRGQIVTAIDLRSRLGLRDRVLGDLPMNVVVRTDDGVVSLLVDEIGDVIEAPEDSFEGPPGTLSGPARELVSGVSKLNGRLLLSLDVRRAVDVTTPVSK